MPVPARLFQPVARRFGIPRVEWFERADVVFGPNFVPPPTRIATVVLTVHDLAHRRRPGTAPRRTAAWLEELDRWINRARRIIAPSEWTRRDLEELYGVEPERVAVVPHGVDHSLFHPTSSNRPPGRPYLLYLGGIEPRKNLPRLLQAFGALPGDLDLDLVVAGPAVRWNPEGPTEFDRAVALLPEAARRRIRPVGYTAGEAKARLIGDAVALVNPSLYEGFGLQILEAMACGTPVLASNVSSMPEVAGDAAVLVDPVDVGAIRDAIDRLARDHSLRERLRAAGLARAAAFTWTETARRTASVLHEAAGE